MNKKQLPFVLLIVLASMFLAACGSIRLIVETVTPTPPSTVALAPTDTPTLTLTATRTMDATRTLDPDCLPMQGLNLSLSQAIVGSWKNGAESVWTFCKSGKLIETLSGDAPEVDVQQYMISGDTLTIGGASFTEAAIDGDTLTLTVESSSAGFAIQFERLK